MGESVGTLSDKIQRDWDLVQLVLNGDQNASEKLVSDYWEIVYNVSLRLTKNSMDAEDLTIEAFCKALKQLHTYRPTHSFATWMLSIASHHCVDFIRKQAQMPKVSVTPTYEKIDEQARKTFIACEDKLGQTPSAEDDIIKDQDNRWVMEILAYLKPVYRQLIEMRYIREMSYEQIAQETQMPMGSVKSRISRARQMLITAAQLHAPDRHFEFSHLYADKKNK